MSTCAECDRPQIWAGTAGWHPHSDEDHARWRHQLTELLLRRVREWIAARAGHKVTIRFTATTAWAECSCSWRGLTWPHSSYAAEEGHEHLATLGGMLATHTLLTAAPCC